MTVRLPMMGRLKAVADLGPYEINVGALSAVHVGKLVAVRSERNTLTGRLQSVPSGSVTKPAFCLVGGLFPARSPADAWIDAHLSLCFAA